MKTISVRDLQKNIKEIVDSAQRDRIVVTRRGEPAAVLLGVEGKDWESVVLETSPGFWKLIEARRREPTLSAEEVEESISAGEVRERGRRRGLNSVRTYGRTAPERPVRFGARIRNNVTPYRRLARVYRALVLTAPGLPRFWTV